MDSSADRIDVDRIRIRCGSVCKCGQAFRVPVIHAVSAIYISLLLHSVGILCMYYIIHCAIQNTGNQNNNNNNFVRDSTCTWFGVQEYNGSVFWY